MIRKAEYPIDKIFINRWSPRAMTGEPVNKQELMSLFEAARWAPSSYNNQPWRFMYTYKDSDDWQLFFNLLAPGNQKWAKDAGILIVVASHTLFAFNNKPSRTHSFDAGAAWENLALQASIMGLAVHGMEGFNYERARSELNIPQEYAVEAMIAVGRPAHDQREELTDRMKVDEFAFEGKFRHE
jgi:nitroreductase